MTRRLFCGIAVAWLVSGIVVVLVMRNRAVGAKGKTRLPNIRPD